MSLYRQSGGSGWRVALVAAVVALLIGGAVGYAIGRSAAPEPSLSEQVGELQRRLQPTLDGLALVPDHYAQGVKPGGAVQYEGAVQQVNAARANLAAEATELEAIDRSGYEAAVSRIDALIDAIEARQPPARVDHLVAQAEAAVAAASGKAPAGSAANQAG